MPLPNSLRAFRHRDFRLYFAGKGISQTGTCLQMIATSDIGRHAARAFTDAEKLRGREIDLAGDAATMPEAAAALSKGLGRNITFVQIPISEVRKNSEDFALMLEWFERVGYDVDIAGVERESGIHATTLEEWAGTLERAKS